MADRKLSVSDVFARGFAAVHSNPIVFFGTPLIVSGIPTLIGSLVTAALVADGSASPMANPVSVVIGIATFLIGLIGQGALVQATLAHGQGRKAGFGEVFAAGLRYYLPLFGAILLAWIGIVIGLTLLLVPGILLATMWVVIGPAIVGEDSGLFGSFGRSYELTRGSRWRIFGFFVLLWVILMMAVAALGLVGFLLGVSIFRTGAGFSIANLVLQVVSGIVLTSYWIALLTSLFIELRALRGDAEPDHLADVFA